MANCLTNSIGTETGSLRVGALITPDLEIAVVDDASTDGSGALLDCLADEHPQVRPIHHPVNRKLGGALKTGFAATTKEWILYMDSDLPIRMDEALYAVPLAAVAVDARHIRAEVAAQISRVLEAGIKPTHLDSHQHLHLLPPILTVVMEAVASAGIPVVRLLDDRSQGRGLRREILARLCVVGIRSADHFWGLAHSGCMNETNLRRVLERLKDGVNEIMCHPGFSDPPTRARYPWRYHWDDETAALTSTEIRAYVDDHDIRLANSRDAWES